MIVGCSAIGATAWYFLKDSFGYLQVAPICLVPRLFAMTQKNLISGPFRTFENVNFKLLGFVYVPYVIVFVVNFIGLALLIWKKISFTRSLLTIKQYLAWYLVYTILLGTFYGILDSVHTCFGYSATYAFNSSAETPTDDTTNNQGNTEIRIVQFPPSCVSWRGYQCKDENPEGPNPNHYAVQNIFFALFCLRGVTELLLFLHLNIGRIIDVIRDREYRTTSLRSKSTMSQPLNEDFGVQSLQCADKNTRNDIMAFTQVRAPPPHDSAPALPCSRRNTT